MSKQGELKSFEGVKVQTVEVSLWRFEQLMEEKEMSMYVYNKMEG